MRFYIIHAADIGKDPAKCRPVATGDENDLTTPELFAAWLQENHCAFPAAIVQDDGTVVMRDPRNHRS